MLTVEFSWGDSDGVKVSSKSRDWKVGGRQRSPFVCILRGHGEQGSCKVIITLDRGGEVGKGTRGGFQ